jgi:uncharacterized protein
MENELEYTAFAGDRRIVSGDLRTMLTQTKDRIDQGETERVLIFDDQTGQQVDFDFSGTPEEVVMRALPPKPGRGRPKLGVVGREVSLLPRHWEWLEQQPHGISATLRRLVEEARKRDPAGERARAARDAASRFMWAMAGNLPDFEEASRALFAGDRARLAAITRDWPEDVRSHVERLIRRGD